jgi:hypothetical protein
MKDRGRLGERAGPDEHERILILDVENHMVFRPVPENGDTSLNERIACERGEGGPWIEEFGGV